MAWFSLRAVERSQVFRFSAICLATAAGPACAQLDPLWIRQFGSNKDDFALSAVADGEGGVFVAGYTYGQIGDQDLGGKDLFVVRYDSTGALGWARQFGTDTYDWETAAAPDGGGGVFVGGVTSNTQNGPDDLQDCYLASVGADGQQRWARQFGWGNLDQLGALAADGAGGVIAAGSTNPDWKDAAFFERFDSAGEPVWLRLYDPAEGFGGAAALAPDDAGGFFAAGYSTGGSDLYVGRFEENGDPIWIATFGAAKGDRVGAMVSDGQGGVFVGGNTPNALGGPNAGDDDIFLARFDAAGQPLWITQAGTAGRDGLNALAADGEGGVFLAGSTAGEFACPEGGGDAILARYDENGGQTWVTQFGTEKGDGATGVAPDGTGGVFIAGTTQGAFGGANHGQRDGFLVRFGSLTCPADLDKNGTLDLNDVLLFAGSFNRGEKAADCDRDCQYDLFDFLCFLNEFGEGC